MTTQCFLAPDPIQSTFFIPGSNTPGNGVQVFFYVSGTTTKQTVYKDNAAAASWTNPIVLDSGGNLPSGGSVWFPITKTYTVVWAPANDTDPPASPYRTINNVSGINDTGVANSGVQWLTGATPTFIGATSFRVDGDQTGIYDVGRKVNAVCTGGTAYGIVYARALATGSTTVQLLMDAGSVNLDAGLSVVQYGVLTSLAPATPAFRTSGFYIEDATAPTKLVKFSVSTAAVSTTVNVQLPTTSGTMARIEDFAFLSTSGVARFPLPNDWISGFQINNSASSDAMDIGKGQATDSTNSFNIVCSTVFNRKTTAAFAAGPSSGAKMSAAAMSTNCWYAWYALLGSSGAVDFGFDTNFPSSTYPTTTTAFPVFRYIGGRKTNVSTTVWETFTQRGDEVYRGRITTTDVFKNNPGTAASSYTIYVPPNPVVALMNVFFEDIDAGGRVNQIYMFPPDSGITDYTPGSSGALTPPIGSFGITGGNGGALGQWFRMQLRSWTNSSSQVRASVTSSDGNVNLGIATYAWIDPRGKPIT